MTWFDKLSPAAQKAYIKAHPNSKYAKSKPSRKDTSFTLKEVDARLKRYKKRIKICHDC